MAAWLEHLAPPPAPPLTQASDITGGVYLKLPEPAALLQFLLVTPAVGKLTAVYTVEYYSVS